MRKQQYETSAKIAMVALIGIVLSLTIMIGIGKHEPVQEAVAQEPILWTPSIEEQRRMDSLYSIDAVTKADMDSIMDMIDAILIKLD
jgi:DNA mismatch repair protein MutH